MTVRVGQRHVCLSVAVERLVACATGCVEPVTLVPDDGATAVDADMGDGADGNPAPHAETGMVRMCLRV